MKKLYETPLADLVPVAVDVITDSQPYALDQENWGLDLYE